MTDVNLPLPDLLDGEVVVFDYRRTLARLLAVGVKVDLGELDVVEAVVGGGQEARGDQGGAAQEGLGRRKVTKCLPVCVSKDQKSK